MTIQHEQERFSVWKGMFWGSVVSGLIWYVVYLVMTGL